MTTSDQEKFIVSAKTLALLDFAKASAVEHGFGWLDSDGKVDPSKTVQLWITGRMTHCFALGHLMGVPGSKELAEHGIKSLRHSFKDPECPGWFSALNVDGTPVEGPKESYAHAFVMLAAASAMAAGIAGADELLSQAIEVLDNYYWESEYQMVYDQANRDFSKVDPYRGINANMHTVEAMLSVASALKDDNWIKRTLAIVERVAALVIEFDGRLPEHFDTEWHPQLSFNKDKPADPFRPYGATIGHWLEWARLIAQTRLECDLRGISYSDSLKTLPGWMYRQSLLEGWGANGEPGFGYTVDFDSKPVVNQRMHWVLCEAIDTAVVLKEITGDQSYEHDIKYFWDYATKYLIERPGAWIHELNPDNTPAQGTWSGKPDIYHALQSTIIEQLPVAPSFAWALKNLTS